MEAYGTPLQKHLPDINNKWALLPMSYLQQSFKVEQKTGTENLRTELHWHFECGS